MSEELELEDPKDLRAEIGKCPNSTNERKNMSIKTIYKRIALVTVAALGAGFLSVAPAQATAVVADDVTVTSTSLLLICARGTGAQSVVAPSNSAGVVFGFTAASASETAYVKVSGPGVISAVGTGVTIVSQTAASVVVHSTPADSTFTIKPTGVGTISVSISDTSSSPVLDVLTFTSVESCSTGTYSATNSYAAAVDSTTAATADSSWTNTNVDSTGATVISNGLYGYVKVTLADVYGLALSSSGTLVATATNGAKVGVVAYNGSLVPGGTSTAALTGSGADHVVIVGQGTANAPASTTVTLTYNGTTVATKSFTLLGAPSRVTVSDITIGDSTNGSGKGYFVAKVTDAAGNPIGSKNIVADTTFNAAASQVVSSVAAGSTTTSAVTGKTSAAEDSTAASFTCTTKGGTASLKVKVAVDAGGATFVTSDAFTVNCGGALDTWSISMDKAVYAPGEIATLTVSGKDADGRAVYTALALSTIEQSFGGMEFVTAPTSVDKFSSAAGAKTYKLAVGTSEGAFVGTFKIVGATDTAAKTVQYKVAGAAGVSNADVLKAIVSLIASINKQIAALQKALLRR